MKVVAYGIKPHEKILLAKVNKKVHDITIIANKLSVETINYSAGKEALVLTNCEVLTPAIIETISLNGIKLIISWNSDVYAIDPACEFGEMTAIHLTTSDLEPLDNSINVYNEHTMAIRFVRKTIQSLNEWSEYVNKKSTPTTLDKKDLHQ